MAQLLTTYRAGPGRPPSITYDDGATFALPPWRDELARSSMFSWGRMGAPAQQLAWALMRQSGVEYKAALQALPHMTTWVASLPPAWEVSEADVVARATGPQEQAA